MWSLMAACDVLVNLRSPTMGETSGSVIRALSLGKPMLVSDVGWFTRAARRRRAEDPGRRVRGADARRRRSSSRPSTRAELGAGGARVRRARARPRPQVADAYAAALEEAAGGDAVDDAVLWRVAEAAAEIGIDDAAELARAARGCRGSSRDRRAPRRSRRGCGSRRSSCSRSSLRIALARRMVAPWIMVDELVYSELAKSFAAHGQFLVRGVPIARLRLRLPGADRAGVAALQLDARRPTRPRRRSTRC